MYVPVISRCLPSTHGPTAVETTQADLKAEIAHTQTLQNKNPKASREPSGSTIHARTSLANDPKHGVTMRLYEDLTNLIVLSAKIQESPYAHLGASEEITYRCVFSHTNSGRFDTGHFCVPLLTRYCSKSIVHAHVDAPTQAFS